MRTFLTSNVSCPQLPSSSSSTPLLSLSPIRLVDCDERGKFQTDPEAASVLQFVKESVGGLARQGKSYINQIKSAALKGEDIIKVLGEDIIKGLGERVQSYERGNRLEQKYRSESERRRKESERRRKAEKETKRATELAAIALAEAETAQKERLAGDHRLTELEAQIERQQKDLERYQAALEKRETEPADAAEALSGQLQAIRFNESAKRLRVEDNEGDRDRAVGANKRSRSRTSEDYTNFCVSKLKQELTKHNFGAEVLQAKKKGDLVALYERCILNSDIIYI